MSMKRAGRWDRACVLAKTRGRCLYCNVRLKYKGGDVKDSFVRNGKRHFVMEPRWFMCDHFIPRSKRGGTTIRNLVPACRVCNCAKNDQTGHQFAPHLAKRFARRSCKKCRGSGHASRRFCICVMEKIWCVKADGSPIGMVEVLAREYDRDLPRSPSQMARSAMA